VGGGNGDLLEDDKLGSFFPSLCRGRVVNCSSKQGGILEMNFA